MRPSVSHPAAEVNDSLSQFTSQLNSPAFLGRYFSIFFYLNYILSSFFCCFLPILASFLSETVHHSLLSYIYTALIKSIFLKICVVLNLNRHEQCLLNLLQKKKGINPNFPHLFLKYLKLQSKRESAAFSGKYLPPILPSSKGGRYPLYFIGSQM